jgi:3-oxoadipate enol-lactonase
MTETPTSAGHRARVGDISIYCEVHGTGTPLVLIGGLGADVTMVAAITSEFAERHQVLTFDNRGAGRSDQPDQPYTIAQMANDTASLMDALDLPRADIMGFSMGGRIALELALTRPKRVRRLVLVSTSARGRGRLTMSAPMRVLWLLRWAPPLRKRYPQSEGAYRRQRQATLTYDAVDRITSVTAPALILHGRRDRTVPVDLVRELATQIPGAQLTLFRGGHMFFLFGQRHDVVHRVENFLAEP